MDINKLYFVSAGFLPLLDNLSADKKGKWGKMNGQQMIEHLSGFFAISNGKIKFPLITPIEHLPKFREFLFSDKDFKENTKAPILPEEPFLVRCASMGESVTVLQKEVKDFVKQFSTDDVLTREHPVFGELNFEEWVLLHHKHVTHHLRQFELLL